MVPPGAAQRAAHVAAPAIVIFQANLEAVERAAGAAGITTDLQGGELRLVAAPDELSRLRSVLQDRGEHETAEALGRYLAPERQWKLRTRELPLDRPHVMGILNLTEDSFSGDGVGSNVAAALRRAEELRSAGVAIVDVGAETARADRPALDAADEAAAVAPVVAALTREGHCVSIDTYKPAVAVAALDAGAEAVNDISGLTLGAGAASQAAKAAAGYVLNYSYSVPKRRPDRPPVYADVVAETVDWMSSRVAALRELGIADGRIAVDPGIAFGKSHDEDLQVLRRLGEFRTLGLPILLAHSRKNFIGSISGPPPQDRDLETHVAAALAFEQGARIFRVHDAAGAARALEIAAAITASAAGAFAPDGESWPWRAGASAAHMTRAASDKAAPPGQRW